MSLSTPPVNAPINIDTKITKIDDTSNELVFNYYQGICKSTKSADFVSLKYSNEGNNIVYKGYTYTLLAMTIFKRSLHSFDDTDSSAELLMVHHNNNEKQSLIICIPINTSVEKSSFGRILEKVPSKVENFKSPKTFIPPGIFYSYTSSSIFPKLGTTEYVVFKTSELKIKPAELALIPSHSSAYKQTEFSGTVYKNVNATSKNTLLYGDSEVFVDCQPIGASDAGGNNKQIDKADDVVKSINFTDLQNNKFVQMFLMFVVIMIVMVIFFYSYEFTTGMFRELTKSVSMGNKPS